MDDIESNEEAAGRALHLEDKTEPAVEESPKLSKKSSTKNPAGYLDSPEIFTDKLQKNSGFKIHTINLTAGRKVLSAVKKDDVLSLSELFKGHYSDEEGNTVLHYAVLSACEYHNTVDDMYQCIDRLLNKKVNLNKPNKKGYTALGLAAHHHQKGCVEKMLKHPLAHRLYIDYYPAERESTLREILTEKYPDLQSLLPSPLKENLDSGDTKIKLLAALQHDEYDIFAKHLNLSNTNPWYDEPYYSTLLEIACQMKNREGFVRLLFENGADPNIANRVTGMPLLHATARSGNFELLETLLGKNKIDVSLTDNENRTILHWWARVSERKSQDKKRLEKCFQHLMRSELNLKASINTPDSSGKSALYTTVERRFQDRATLLLTWGADVIEFENGSRILLSDNLSMLEEILDNCLESNDKPMTSEDYKLTFRYRLLTNIIPRMAESHHLRDLLRHSVISTFLNFKWQPLKRIFFLDLAFYVTFVALLTAYLLYSESYDTINDGGVANNNSGPFSFDNTCKISGTNYVTLTSRPNFRREVKRKTDDSNLQILWYSLMIWLGLLTTREMFQLLIYHWNYIRSLNNWLKILLFIATFISCAGVIDSFEIELHFSAVAILLGWLELLMMSGRLPLLSEQLELLKTVSLTFLRFMAGYAILLIAFALSFYILFKGSLELDGTEMFTNPLLSLLKTSVMFTGEFDASSLSFDILPYTSHVIFLLFVFLVTIILLNLLNGLAVNDTDAIRKKAETLSLVARVKLITQIETLLSVLPSFMTPSMNPTEDTFVLYPNRQNSVGSIRSRSILRIISKKSQPHRKWKSFGNQDKWNFFTETFSALQLRHKGLQEKFDLMYQVMNHILWQQKESQTNFDLKFEETKDILSRHKELEKKFDLMYQEMKSMVSRHKYLENKFDVMFHETKDIISLHKGREEKFNIKFEETKHILLQILTSLDIRKKTSSTET